MREIAPSEPAADEDQPRTCCQQQGQQEGENQEAAATACGEKHPEIAPSSCTRALVQPDAASFNPNENHAKSNLILWLDSQDSIEASRTLHDQFSGLVINLPQPTDLLTVLHRLLI